MAVRHFLSLLDLAPEEAEALVARAMELRRRHHAGERGEAFRGRVLALLFEKSSTRTRVSFEAAVAQWGGAAMFLSPRDTQLGRGEPLEDTARVLSRMVDAIVVRTFEHEKLQRFAAHATVPVINALTDRFHPCQLLADVQTFCEHRGPIRGRTVAWIGDGNNVCHSWINAARLFGFHLRIAVPAGYEPDPAVVAAAAERVTLTRDPLEAAAGADLVVTDVWASMGQEEERAARLAAFAPYQVDRRVMEAAGPEALFMHCLPAHRGEEVAAEVIDGPWSVVWDEAENRLHAQRALLELLWGVRGP
ncbi:ornithine carbamoyltransferase [Inmirania thermothiophila]|uniref:Ornithine carbamoyltransferase n=1 Tax=Inmirania thermothiophila TaxID=1750597 RepID=A0A3N1Y885_9GAMM|nr:ornithine carbamoyltransferase [Inmirania thermothiophila]ROR35026.1 ornithine carbamoyltransferase [Inmirania thermothiophila]